MKRATSTRAPRGRAAAENPANRFERLHFEPDAGVVNESNPETVCFVDRSRSILSHNESPDVGFDYSINPYRGCEHGCIYCYARPSHEYLGLSTGLDFETKLLVKQDAPELLRRELSARSWRPQPVALCGVTDPYQPVERHLELTRACIDVLHEFRNPLLVITKNHLVTRDAGRLAEMAAWNGALVNISLTTLDAALQRRMEPRASSPAARLQAIENLSRAGVPVRVLVAPVIPGLTDHEMAEILKSASSAGAVLAGYVMLRLPHGVKDLFQNWIQRCYPERASRVMNRVREVRSGRLNDPRFGSRMGGEGPYAEQIARLFEVGCRKAGLSRCRPGLSAHHFRRPATHRKGQLGLFC